MRRSPWIQLLNDIRAFGAYTALRATARKFGQGVLRLDIRGLGPVHLRRGDTDYYAVRQIVRDGQYRIGGDAVGAILSRRHDEILSRGATPVILDAGANIGVASLWFARLFPRAIIVAVEPDAGNVGMLRRNTAACPHIVVEAAAIGSAPGFAKVQNEPGLSWMTTTERADRGCPVITVDQAVSHVEGGVLFIAKIDIEGFEGDLFSANLDWIDTAAAIYLEPHDWRFPGRGTSRSFQRAMGRRQFEVHLVGENLLYVNSAYF